MNVQFRMLCNEELCDLCRSYSVVSIVRSRKLHWAGCMSDGPNERSGRKFYWGSFLESSYFEIQKGNRRTILILIFRYLPSEDVN